MLLFYVMQWNLLGAERGYNNWFNNLRALITVQSQPTSSVDCGTSESLTHIEDITGHMSAIAWKHANNARIDHTIHRGKWATNPSATHRNPFDTTTEVHVVFASTPTAIGQMKIKTYTGYIFISQKIISPEMCGHNTYDVNNPLLEQQFYFTAPSGMKCEQL